MNRRTFLQSTTLVGSVLMVPVSVAAALPGRAIETAGTVGKLGTQGGDTPIEGASWYIAEAEGDGLTYRFAPGTLAGMRYLAADMLLDGNHLAVWTLTLREGEEGRAFRFRFGALNQCSFRMRMPLDLVDQNRWRIDREGAFLKPMCYGDRVDLAEVDRMSLTVARKGPHSVRWCMTPLHAAETEVEKLSQLVLPKGRLIDELGQSNLHEWPGKTRGVEQLKRRITDQLERAPSRTWPDQFSRWGGWKSKRLDEAAGFFRVRRDGNRWWLVDPDGCAFWSTGLDCVRVDCEARHDGLESALAWLPDSAGEFREIYRTSERARLSGEFVNYLAANLIRAFGPSNWRDKWAEVALAELKRLRFNTVGNWSDWEYAAQAGFPYVRPMNFRAARAGYVYRDFPDVFHPGFEADVAEFADQLKPTADDPAFVGYFLMNEPTWGFASELPAAGMLYNTASSPTRDELARFLRSKYPHDGALARAWNMGVTFERVARGNWRGILGPEALDDLRAFSVRMVEKYFQALSEACRKVDPNHLNLGMRWAGIPPEWAVEGMKSFDVFSLNCYREKLPYADAEKIHAMLDMPVLVGEWHFGALDAGLPASGIGHVPTQEDRGKAYRIYLEDAAANPYCVGAHWFTLYDQSALGRFDGENYNIGFLDICNQPYREIGEAAVASHERMYEIADGRAEPFTDAPEHLPRLYL